MENLMWCIRGRHRQKAVIIISTFLLLTLNCISQSTFSKRFAYGYSAGFTMLMNTDYGYLAICEGRDSIGEFFAPLLAVTFDEQGDWISTKTYGSADMEFFYDTMSDSNIRLNDSTFVILTAYYHENTDTNYVAAMWLNEYGDTLQTRKYTSPYYVEGVLNTDFNGPAALAVSEDGEFLYYATQIFHSSSQNNFMIKKLTAIGEEVWSYVNPLGNGSGCNSIAIYNEQIWFIRVSSSNRIIGLNEITGLEMTNEIISPNLLEAVRCKDLIIENGDFIMACIDISLPGNLLPIIYKCSSTGDEVFQTSPQGAFYDLSQNNDHLVKSPDGGYVACSVKYESQINPNDPNDPSSNNTSEKIWLWKVDSDGVFQWQRFYEYLSFDSGYFYLENTANDMKLTPDGGFIMAGEATARCLEWPCLPGAPFTQQGWLLKVDGCGCLVPGCDEDCTVGMRESSLEKPSYFKYGPNPVGDNLHVYLPKYSSIDAAEVSLLLSTTDGQRIRQLPLKHDNTTYIIDTSSLSTGVYLLHLMDGNTVLQTERLVVEQ